MLDGSVWTIQLLGGLAARSQDRLATRFRTQKAAVLLAYLAFYNALNRPPHPRETLIGLLWPDTDVDAGRNSARRRADGRAGACAFPGPDVSLLQSEG
jgi:DNA-binding SARP family transcriptional activator